jgi:hypothetical protein
LIVTIPVSFRLITSYRVIARNIEPKEATVK